MSNEPMHSNPNNHELAQNLLQFIRDTIERQTAYIAASYHAGFYSLHSRLGVGTDLGPGLLLRPPSEDDDTDENENSLWTPYLNQQLIALRSLGLTPALEIPEDDNVPPVVYDLVEFGQYIPHQNAWRILTSQTGDDDMQWIVQRVPTRALVDNLTLYTKE